MNDNDQIFIMLKCFHHPYASMCIANNSWCLTFGANPWFIDQPDVST